MKYEKEILQSSLSGKSGNTDLGLDRFNNAENFKENTETLDLNRFLNAQAEENLKHAPGRKLDGKTCPSGRINPDIRYKMSKLTDQSAVIRQWEDTLLRGLGEPTQNLLASRIFYSRARGYPVCVMSVLQYNTEAERAKMERTKNIDSFGLEVYKQPARDWRGISYMSFLQVM